MFMGSGEGPAKTPCMLVSQRVADFYCRVTNVPSEKPDFVCTDNIKLKASEQEHKIAWKLAMDAPRATHNCILENVQ